MQKKCLSCLLVPTSNSVPTDLSARSSHKTGPISDCTTLLYSTQHIFIVLPLSTRPYCIFMSFSRRRIFVFFSYIKLCVFCFRCVHLLNVQRCLCSTRTKRVLAVAAHIYVFNTHIQLTIAKAILYRKSTHSCIL